MFSFPAHCRGSASPTPGGAPAKHFRQHPASVSRFGFRRPRANPSAPKSFAGPSENAPPSAALGSRAETTYTPSDKALATLSLATKTSWTKDDERQERTEWHRIQAWAKLAEYAAGFKKGAHLRVEGELRSREYEPTPARRSAPT